MKILKRVMLLLVILFVIIQFIRPSKNISDAAPSAHISKNFPVPDDVKQILSTSCYDCHSNNTRYPWYNHVQPIAWWLNDHVTEGKKHLNFDEFSSYRLRRQFHKFEEIGEMVKEDEMPLNSYTLIHRDASLSVEQKFRITQWCSDCMNKMQLEYPLDSLVQK
jgi:hypothetical protein